MELIETYPMATVCQVVDYPRSQVYYRPQAVEDESDLNGAILTLAGQHPTYGYRRITAMLKRQGQAVNHKRVARVMQELGLMGKPPVKRKRTTNSQHEFQRYPNRVMNLEIERPDQVWVGDITYIRLQQDFGAHPAVGGVGKKKEGAGKIVTAPNTNDDYEHSAQTERLARSTREQRSFSRVVDGDAPASDGDGGVASRIDGGPLATGDGANPPCPSAAGLAKLPSLWESAALQRISAAADADLGGCNCLKATGGSLSSGLP